MRLWLGWLCSTTLGWGIGWNTAWFVGAWLFGSNPAGPADAALVGVSFGVVVGTVQSFALRLDIAKAWSWAIATSLAWAIGFGVGAVLRSPDASVTLTGAVGGAAAGMLQCRLLGGYVLRPGWWVLTNTVGWSLSLPISRVVREVAAFSLVQSFGVPEGLFAADLAMVAVGGTIAGAITGLALPTLLLGKRAQLYPLRVRCAESIDVSTIRDLLKDPYLQHEIAVDLDDTKRLFYKEPVRLGWIKRGENETVRRNRMLPANMLMVFPRRITGLGRRNLILHARGPELTGFPLDWRPPGHVAVRFPDEVRAIHGTSANPKLLNLCEVGRELGLVVDLETLRLERSAAALRNREGTVVIARLPYYYQRILLDEDGTTIWLGMDESKDRTTHFMVYTAPSTTKGLVRYAYYGGYRPILRWRTVPPTWPYYVPLCDYPMANELWRDLYVREQGRAQLFSPKPSVTVADWEVMLQMLERLWLETLAKVGYRLLVLTSSRQQMDDYFEQKYKILGAYFEIHEVTIKPPNPPLQPTAEKRGG